MRTQIWIIATLSFVAGTGAGAFAVGLSNPSGVSAPSTLGSNTSAASDPSGAAAVGTVLQLEAVDTLSEVPTDTPPTPAVTPAEPLAPALVARLDSAVAALSATQGEVRQLRQRVATLERQLAAAEQTSPVADTEAAPRARTHAEQRDALVRAGVAAEVAEDLLWRQAEVALERLELRDLAIREGWFGSDRYREELGRLDTRQVSLRDELGVSAYDRYLFESGQDNRIRIASVMPGSAGEQSGLASGDLVVRYDGEPIFDVMDLRTATTEGERGEMVSVEVIRGDSLVEVLVPRGPIGIGLDSVRVAPQP